MGIYDEDKIYQNSKIRRFCKLTVLINEINDKLDKEFEDFYYGGHSFVKVYRFDFDELKQLENEFRSLLKDIYNELENNTILSDKNYHNFNF